MFVKHTKTQSGNQTLETLLPKNTAITMTASNSFVSYQSPLPTERKLKGRGNKIVVGRVVKAKIGELEEEVRVGSSIRMRKELTGLVQGV